MVRLTLYDCFKGDVAPFCNTSRCQNRYYKPGYCFHLITCNPYVEQGKPIENGQEDASVCLLLPPLTFILLGLPYAAHGGKFRQSHGF